MAADRNLELGFGKAERSRMSLPPAALVLMSIGSVQIGAALAKGLFAPLGPAGAVLLRVGFAALVLLAVWRPNLRAFGWREYQVALLFGATLAVMNCSFYLAISRIPLGVAVTVEFVGPLGVALAGTRHKRDLVWVALAAVGILALAPFGIGPKLLLDPLGLALALLAGMFWACYILLSARTGQVFAGGSGLALATSVAALLLLPLGVYSGGSALLQPHVILLGIAVALLSSVAPYSLELEALRHLPTRTFGILMSLEPAFAAVAGWVVLREQLSLRSLLAIVLVTIASAGATRARAVEAVAV